MRLWASVLHGRPASLFVETANQFSSEITVSNLTTDRPAVNAKSILGVLTLGVAQGHEIQIWADDEDAEQAVSRLYELVASNFGEA